MSLQGEVFWVGDNADNCQSLACEGGTSGTCHIPQSGPWVVGKVVCGVKSHYVNIDFTGAAIEKKQLHNGGNGDEADELFYRPNYMTGERCGNTTNNGKPGCAPCDKKLVGRLEDGCLIPETVGLKWMPVGGIWPCYSVCKGSGTCPGKGCNPLCLKCNNRKVSGGWKELTDELRQNKTTFTQKQFDRMKLKNLRADSWTSSCFNDRKSGDTCNYFQPVPPEWFTMSTSDQSDFTKSQQTVELKCRKQGVKVPIHFQAKDIHNAKISLHVNGIEKELDCNGSACKFNEPLIGRKGPNTISMVIEPTRANGANNAVSASVKLSVENVVDSFSHCEDNVRPFLAVLSPELALMT